MGQLLAETHEDPASCSLYPQPPKEFLKRQEGTRPRGCPQHSRADLSYVGPARALQSSDWHELPGPPKKVASVPFGKTESLKLLFAGFRHLRLGALRWSGQQTYSALCQIGRTPGGGREKRPPSGSSVREEKRELTGEGKEEGGEAVAERAILPPLPLWASLSIKTTLRGSPLE
ncbi:hypothetical protein TREES_T100000374 [Tupaia chinensis]|uniref:Uncharacterized protein n=1 Tax=Tupaia chinensis TaxID=246437 RepID=L9KX22_TUPCH|nr:hypothetical protein TREES_T100000374 [Tupaia chinensis]